MPNTDSGEKSFPVQYRIICERCGSRLGCDAEVDRFGVVEISVEPCYGCEVWLMKKVKEQKPCQ